MELYKSPFDEDSFEVPMVLRDWVENNIRNKPFRPMSLILLGESRIGKSCWARSLGEHIYYQRGVNWDKWNDNAEYIVIDDMSWEILNKTGNKKVLLGCQSEYEVNPKCKQIRTIKGGIPCIYLTNDLPELDSWDRANALVIDLGRTPLYK